MTELQIDNHHDTKSKLTRQLLIITCLYAVFIVIIAFDIRNSWDYQLSNMDPHNWWGYSIMTFEWFIAHIILSFIVSFTFWVKYDSQEHMKLNVWLLIPLCIIPILIWNSGVTCVFADNMFNERETVGWFLLWKHLFELGVYLVSMVLTGCIAIKLLHKG